MRKKTILGILLGIFVGMPITQTEAQASGPENSNLGGKQWVLSGSNDSYMTVKNQSFEVIVENDSDSDSAVNVLINGHRAETVKPGGRSDELAVPLAPNGEAHVQIKLPDGAEATGKITSYFVYKGGERADFELDVCDEDAKVYDDATYTSCDECIGDLPTVECTNNDCPIWRIYDTDCEKQSNGRFDCSAVGQCKFEL